MKPQENQIYQRIHQIASLENLSIDQEGLNQIIVSSGNDIRQVLNTLQLYGYA